MIPGQPRIHDGHDNRLAPASRPGGYFRRDPGALESPLVVVGLAPAAPRLVIRIVRDGLLHPRIVVDHIGGAEG